MRIATAANYLILARTSKDFVGLAELRVARGLARIAGAGLLEPRVLTRHRNEIAEGEA